MSNTLAVHEQLDSLYEAIVQASQMVFDHPECFATADEYTDCRRAVDDAKHYMLVAKATALMSGLRRQEQD